MSKMKTHVLHFGLSHNPGGIETYLVKLTKSLNQDSFTFVFIDGTPTVPAFHDELQKLGCSFYKVTPRKKSYLKNKRDIAKIFSDNKIDVLHFHVNTLSYIEPVLAALDNNVGVIIHSRNAGSRGSKTTQIMHFINKIRIKRMRNVKKIAVSRLAGEWLFGKKSDFDIYNNGIDLKKFYFSVKARDEVRKKLGISDESLVLGCIAAFTPAKNQQFVIEMLNLMRERGKLGRVKLLFVGDGALKQKVEELVNTYSLHEQVLFLGKRSDIPSIMAAMDVLLLPSFYEGFPNVVLEAQACGLKCLISDRVTDEVIVNATLVKQLSIEEDSTGDWSDQVEAYISEPLDLTQRLSAWKEIDENGFSTDNEIKKMENLYDAVVANRHI